MYAGQNHNERQATSSVLFSDWTKQDRQLPRGPAKGKYSCLLTSKPKEYACQTACLHMPLYDTRAETGNTTLICVECFIFKTKKHRI